MAELAVSGVHHGFGRQQVLKGVDLTAGSGECVVLFGANGAGKSTLLGVLATRYRPQRGSYHLDGLDVAHDGDAIRGKLVMLGHATHLYGHLSPVENLRFFCDLRGLTPELPMVTAAVMAVGLERFMHRPTLGFSAGMKKRVALARVLVGKPGLLLLDEPYSALDAEGIAWLNRMLSGFLDGGGTVVMATHDPERVAALPHRAARLVSGKLV